MHESATIRMEVRMAHTASIVALLGTALLAGCAQTARQEVTADVAPAGVCALHKTRGNTCVLRTNNNGAQRRVCHLYAGVMDVNGSEKPYVFPHRLSTPGPSNIPTVIVWHLLDPRFVFKSDDGPLELKNNNEFSNGKPTDDIDGDPEETLAPLAQGQRYRIRFRNTMGSKTHDYRISFRRSDGSDTRVCDPRIVNDGN
jgi:hypothetical protein